MKYPSTCSKKLMTMEILDVFLRIPDDRSSTVALWTSSFVAAEAMFGPMRCRSLLSSEWFLPKSGTKLR